MRGEAPLSQPSLLPMLCRLPWLAQPGATRSLAGTGTDVNEVKILMVCGYGGGLTGGRARVRVLLTCLIVVEMPRHGQREENRQRRRVV